MGWGMPPASVPCCGAATAKPPSVVVVRDTMADAAARLGHEFLLHPLVGPQDVEDAGCEPQPEEEQKQPRLGAKPPIQRVPDQPADDHCRDQLGSHPHAVRHATSTHLGILVGVAVVPLLTDLAEFAVEVGNPRLERSPLFRGHLTLATAYF